MSLDIFGGRARGRRLPGLLTQLCLVFFATTTLNSYAGVIVKISDVTVQASSLPLTIEVPVTVVTDTDFSLAGFDHAIDIGLVSPNALPSGLTWFDPSLAVNNAVRNPAFTNWSPLRGAFATQPPTLLTSDIAFASNGLTTSAWINVTKPTLDVGLATEIYRILVNVAPSISGTIDIGWGSELGGAVPLTTLASRSAPVYTEFDNNTIDYRGGSITIQAVPEPSTFALLAAAGLWRLRRRVYRVAV